MGGGIHLHSAMGSAEGRFAESRSSLFAYRRGPRGARALAHALPRVEPGVLASALEWRRKWRTGGPGFLLRPRQRLPARVPAKLMWQPAIEPWARDLGPDGPLLAF